MKFTARSSSGVSMPFCSLFKISLMDNHEDANSFTYLMLQGLQDVLHGMTT